MNFKYFENYERLASLTDESVECEICGKVTICFDPVFSREEEMDYICPTCLYEKKLYGRQLFANQGDYNTLLSQIKEIYTDLSEEKQKNLAAEKTNELEQATPHLLTWQDMLWPCLDGDYAKFIGFGSKAFLNKLSSDGNGQELFKTSLHPDLKADYNEEQWVEILPDEMINNVEESSFSTLFYVFRSLTSNEIIIWWDCD